MGGCATKPNKLQAAGVDTKQEEDRAVEVVKQVVQVETKEIEGGRKSLSLLFMENKIENTEYDTKESIKFGVPLEQKPPQNIKEVPNPPAASQEQKNAAAADAT